MRLDLKEILQKDGTIPFSCTTDLSDLHFSAISRFLSPVTASGRVTASAGVLTLTGTVSAEALCLCDRCGREFAREFRIPLDLPLAEDPQDAEDPDLYPIEEDGVDLDEIVSTAFVLGLETKLLCKPDCRGLCDRCGKNLNDGPCGCTAETDPRLAVLGQLLEQE